ncbi:MAG: ATP-binding cassette domain-containing protein [Alphaproteobacteria bacterium]|nr:ATP-binding cassette domain-containing protein [Alphaproteobacteria bacterium]
MSAPSSSELAIRVRGLRTQFGDRVVHENLDLDVRAGEVLAVIGPSGCGKSVLLRQIVGLEHPAAGTVELFGRAERAIGDSARRIGVMFQDGALFSTLTLKENVEVPLKEHTDLSPALISELADLKLVMAGLTAETHHLRPGQISGGMRKRAALARALALDPELLMLDEPTAGLDPVTAGRFDQLIGELASSLKLTVFLVTHDLDTLFETADRIAVVYGGKIAVIGTIDEVIASSVPWVQDYFRGPRGRSAAAAHAEAR